MSVDSKYVRTSLDKHILADGFHPVMDMEKSHGSWLVDERDGSEYLDMFSMFASGAVGYNHPEIQAGKDRLTAAALYKPTLSDIYNIQYAEFVEKFSNTAIPEYLPHAFFIEGGALGVENALKVAFDWKVRKNMAKEIIEKGIKGKLEEIYGMETTLHYPEKYAGTADLVGIYQGRETIIDFKQANRPKKVDYIQDYFLQLGAYTLAHNVVYETNITSGVILLCTVDNLFQDFKIEDAELIMYQNLFLGRLKKFNEMNNLS